MLNPNQSIVQKEFFFWNCATDVHIWTTFFLNVCAEFPSQFEDLQGLNVY